MLYMADDQPLLVLKDQRLKARKYEKITYDSTSL
jgi:hypothetical protein